MESWIELVKIWPMGKLGMLQLLVFRKAGLDFLLLNVSRSSFGRRIVPSQSQAWAHSGFARRRCTSRCTSTLNENREGTQIAGNQPLLVSFHIFRLVQQFYLYSHGCCCIHPGIAGKLQREWFREGEHRKRKLFGEQINWLHQVFAKIFHNIQLIIFKTNSLHWIQIVWNGWWLLKFSYWDSNSFASPDLKWTRRCRLHETGEAPQPRNMVQHPEVQCFFSGCQRKSCSSYESYCMLRIIFWPWKKSSRTIWIWIIIYHRHDSWCS